MLPAAGSLNSFLFFFFLFFCCRCCCCCCYPICCLFFFFFKWDAVSVWSRSELMIGWNDCVCLLNVNGNQLFARNSCEDDDGWGHAPHLPSSTSLFLFLCFQVPIISLVMSYNSYFIIGVRIAQHASACNCSEIALKLIRNCSEAALKQVVNESVGLLSLR